MILVWASSFCVKMHGGMVSMEDSLGMEEWQTFMVSQHEQEPFAPTPPCWLEITDKKSPTRLQHITPTLWTEYVHLYRLVWWWLLMNQNVMIGKILVNTVHHEYIFRIDLYSKDISTMEKFYRLSYCITFGNFLNKFVLGKHFDSWLAEVRRSLDTTITYLRVMHKYWRTWVN